MEDYLAVGIDCKDLGKSLDLAKPCGPVLWKFVN